MSGSPEPRTLAGQVALVTGVTRLAGLGAAIATALAAAGADVGIGYYRPYDRQQPWGVGDSEPAELLARLRGLGVRAAGFEIDLAEPEGATELLASVQDALGPIRILVNNAAHSTTTPIDALTADALDRHYAVNLRAGALLAAAFVRQLRASGGGRIINLTSGQGIDPMPTELAYAATKAGIDALTRSLGAALAGRGITVNAIDPGPTDNGWMSDELRASLEAAAPLGRLATPEDAARLAAWIASADAASVSGEIFRLQRGPDCERLHEAYGRFFAGDPRALAAFLADDVVYHLPGQASRRRHPPRQGEHPRAHDELRTVVRRAARAPPPGRGRLERRGALLRTPHGTAPRTRARPRRHRRLAHGRRPLRRDVVALRRSGRPATASGTKRSPLAPSRRGMPILSA